MPRSSDDMPRNSLTCSLMAVLLSRTQFMTWSSSGQKGSKSGFQEFINGLEESFFPNPQRAVIIDPLNLPRDVIAMQRPFLRDANRKRLVGLLTEDPTEVLPDGAHAVEGSHADGRMKTIGNSASIGLMLVLVLQEGGTDLARMGIFIGAGLAIGVSALGSGVGSGSGAPASTRTAASGGRLTV